MKPSVLMLQNNMNPPGGANTVALWMLDAIVSEFDVTVLTWENLDLERINRFYGTRFKSSDFKVITIPRWIRKPVDLVPDPWLWQRYCVLMRRCKQIGHRFQLLVSAHDETDFGRPGLQYVHYTFQAENETLEQKYRNATSWLEKLRYLFGIRLRPWRLISGFSFERMKSNRTLVNSDWTGALFASIYDSELPETLYPPIVGRFVPPAWAHKEDGFVCIGRFAADKRVDRVIEVLSRVREHHPQLRLHLVGTYSPRDDEDAYYREIRALAARHDDWIHLHENLSRAELIDLVCRQRYGIHGKLQEHFGLAIAEMVAAGCIPFVPNDGGQVEIVGHRQELVYGSDDEAVERIRAVLDNNGLQQELHGFLTEGKSRFSLGTFQQRIRDLLHDAAERPFQSLNA